MASIVITGANRGIGLELTRQYSANGDNVYACCRTPEQATELNQLADSATRSISIVSLDVTIPSSISALSIAVDDSPIDILLNNAGVMGGEKQSAFDMDYDGWLDAFAVNTIGPFRVVEALIDNVKLSKSPKIVTISSQMGSLNRKSTGSYAYRSTKAAVNKVMQVMAEELRQDGIVVCPVHPGWVRTNMGGPNAEITVEESAQGIRTLIDQLTLSDTGKFFKWNGELHDW